MRSATGAELEDVLIRAGEANLAGDLGVPPGAEGIVLFAHGSGSSRKSPRNRAVAETLRSRGIATLLFDLLTPEEEIAEAHTRHLRFDIGLFANRLTAATQWVRYAEATRRLRVGYFGASTGAAAALVAAARDPADVHAIVSRGGRPDLAGRLLPLVTAPTLLIAGEFDGPVVETNRSAFEALACAKELVVIPGATHLFEEEGALEEVASRSAEWFARHLASVR